MCPSCEAEDLQIADGPYEKKYKPQPEHIYDCWQTGSTFVADLSQQGQVEQEDILHGRLEEGIEAVILLY